MCKLSLRLGRRLTDAEPSELCLRLGRRLVDAKPLELYFRRTTAIGLCELSIWLEQRLTEAELFKPFHSERLTESGQ